MDHTERRKKFRAVLAGSKCLSPASVYDPLSARIAEAAVKIDNRFSVLPDRNGGAELTELVEVFSEERLESLAKRIGIKFHQRNL